MRANDFRRLLQMFSDPGSDFEFQQNQVVAQVDGRLLEVLVEIEQGGEIWVVQDGRRVEGSAWVLKNLAKVDILCDRLLNKIEAPNPFILPRCEYATSLEVDPNGSLKVGDAEIAFGDLISSSSPLETTVIYLTSDAGEGKTTLIEHLAYAAASRFKAREGKSLIVPIPLGGRPFLGFDDLVVGTLLNHFRFGYYYYGAFLELVKMGLIIPALDGFEEMFVLKGNGEASSALGSLVHGLNSEGTIILSARRAYFDYQNLSNQSRLLESLGTEAVGFARVTLLRWDKSQFVDFLDRNGFNHGEALAIYEGLAARVGVNSALLTRPVFVEKLAGLAENSDSFAEFLRTLVVDDNDPFEPLINGMLQREANTKWLYQANDLSRPIFTVGQHVSLLAEIASEMWDSSVSSLSVDVVEMVAEIFGEKEGLSGVEQAQARDRIKGHALLVPSVQKLHLQFDHDEFRWFFLGEAIYRMANLDGYRSIESLRKSLRKNQLPEEVIKRFALLVGKLAEGVRRDIMSRIQSLANEEAKASFASENASALLLSITHGHEWGSQIALRDLVFSGGCLRDRNLTNVKFIKCVFAPTELGVAVMNDCSFENCHFIRLEIDDEIHISNVIFDSCRIEGLIDSTKKISLFEAGSIDVYMGRVGFDVVGSELEIEDSEIKPIEMDFCCECVEKIIRIFSSSNHISENMIQLKFGVRAQGFLNDCVPALLEVGALAETVHRGKGSQKQYTLGRSLEIIRQALDHAKGDFSSFLYLMSHV